MASKGGLWGLGYGRRRGITASVKINGVHGVVASRRSATPHEPCCFLARDPLQLAAVNRPDPCNHGSGASWNTAVTS